MNRDVISLYNLPREVKFCEKCVISNQRPRISFDKDNVCSACNFSHTKRNVIDWGQREKELEKLCNIHRRSNGEYDVIVPCSGGKDGSYVAHLLKFKYGMNPLTVTWAPLKPSKIGRKNLDAFIASGFNHILGTPDPVVTRRLTYLSFKYMGDPFLPFIYGQTNFPIQMAIKHNVQLIMYGENGEVEYGGDMKNAMRPTRDIEDSDKHYFSGLPPEFWVEKGIKSSDLFPFRSPKFEEIQQNKTEIHFLSYYKFWDPQENYYYCQEHTGFSVASKRSEGTYSKYASLDDEIDGFHYYLSYIKFGIGRATSDAAHEIRDGKITREEGIALVQRFDHEKPREYFQEFLDFCSITEEEVNEVIDSWRSEHLWIKNGEEWNLRNPVWKTSVQ